MTKAEKFQPHQSFGGQIVSFGVIQIIQRGRGFLSFLILTRLIGPYGYGLIAPLIALSSFIQILVLLETNSALNIIIPRVDPNRKARNFWGIFQTTGLSSLLIVILLALAFGPVRHLFLPSEVPFSLFLCGIVIIPFSTLQLVLYSQIINNRQGRAFAKITGYVSVIEVALLFIGAFLFNVHGVLIVYVISQFLQCVFMIGINLRNDSFVLLNTKHIKELKEYYAYGLTMLLSGLASWAIDSSDRLILSKFVSPTDLGAYAAVYNLCAQLNQLGAPMFASLMPFVVGALKQNDTTLARHYLEKSYRVLTYLFVPSVLLFILCGVDIVRLLATEEFIKGTVIIPFIVIGLALWQVNGVHKYNVHAHQKGKWLISSTLIGATINIGYNLIFIPRYGILAAAHSTFAAYSVMYIINMFFSHRLLPFGLRPSFIAKLIAICLISFLPVFLLGDFLAQFNILVRLSIIGIYSSLTYLGSTYLFHLFDASEKESLINAVKNFLPKREGK